MPTLWNFFNHKLILNFIISFLMHLLRWFLFFSLMMWCITLIDLWMLKNLFIHIVIACHSLLWSLYFCGVHYNLSLFKNLLIWLVLSALVPVIGLMLCDGVLAGDVQASPIIWKYNFPMKPLVSWNSVKQRSNYLRTHLGNRCTK